MTAMLRGHGDYLPAECQYAPCEACRNDRSVDDMEWQDGWKGHVCEDCRAKASADADEC